MPLFKKTQNIIRAAFCLIFINFHIKIILNSMFSIKFILIKIYFVRKFDTINCVDSTLQSLLILILIIIYEVCILYNEESFNYYSDD